MKSLTQVFCPHKNKCSPDDVIKYVCNALSGYAVRNPPTVAITERRHSGAASSYSAVKAWLGHIVEKVRKHIPLKIKRFKGRLFG